MHISDQSLREFAEALTEYYRLHGRHDMLWRQSMSVDGFDPYEIMVSEIMLQQTQVSRVSPKYTEFLQCFPNVRALAAAPLSGVLTAWSGLGYNRRAKYLWQAATKIVDDHAGAFPRDRTELQKLPGIGPNTAGAIMAYAYDAPVLFVETNIRTVIIHHFFEDQDAVADKAIVEILATALPYVTAEKDVIASNREFYWAMMDYGSFLKKTVGNRNRASTTYSKQSAFHGSKRQLRGRILRLLIKQPQYEVEELINLLADKRADEVLAGLVAESMVQRRGQVISLGTVNRKITES